MAMNLWFYVTDTERDELIEFMRNIDGLYILPSRPGRVSGLSSKDILQNNNRLLSCVPAEEVAVQVLETQIGTVRSWNDTRTPLIDWNVPYQRDNLIIGGNMRLMEYPSMEPHQELRSEYLATRKLLNAIKGFMAERFVKKSPTLFNGPIAIDWMDNRGYEGLPFDPETTDIASVSVATGKSSHWSIERVKRWLRFD